MAHKSRLGAIVVDCKTDDLTDALAFWSAALGLDGAVDPDGKYAVLKSANGDPKVLLQRVSHDSRVHLDIATDDIPAEVRRLEALGARRVASVRAWVVMEAPTGHRFCVVRAKGRDFEERAHLWPDEPD